MRTLIVVAYPNEMQAEQVRLDFLKMQKDYLLDLEDAVVAVVKPNGKVKLRQMYHLALGGAVSGSFWGLLIGLIFLNPLLGLVVGAGTGAVAGALTDVGISDNFMKELAAQLKPGSSVLFVLVRSELTDKVLDELRGTGGVIMQTSLSHDEQSRLQAAMDSAAAPAQAGPVIPAQFKAAAAPAVQSPAASSDGLAHDPVTESAEAMLKRGD